MYADAVRVQGASGLCAFATILMTLSGPQSGPLASDSGENVGLNHSGWCAERARFSDGEQSSGSLRRQQTTRPYGCVRRAGRFEPWWEAHTKDVGPWARRAPS